MSKKYTGKRLEALFDDISIPKSKPRGKEEAAQPGELLEIPLDETRPASLDPQSAIPDASVELSCPHIGLVYDPQTSLAYPSEWNLCHRASPAIPPNYEHQRVYCLTGSYAPCPFFRKKPDTPLPDYIRL